MQIEKDYSLVKSSTLVHEASGVKIQTPLLVPSFSSKGFAGAGEKSEVRQMLETAWEFLTTTYLISAYDIERGHLPKPAQLAAPPEAIILDSGGYEISDDYDFAEVARIPVADQKWELHELESVINSWPAEIPTVLVSYDHPRKRKLVAQQIEEARQLFRKYPSQFSCLLLKPETPTQKSMKEALAAAIAQADQLASFDIIGVTEKGLAPSAFDRMLEIARLRRALNEAKCNAPIHVFGSLDPLSVCLYTVAGAEIFDGLTWLRYAFVNDQAVYPNSRAAQAYDLEAKDTARHLQMISSNYYYLNQLQSRLRHFAATKDARLLPNAQLIKQAASLLKTRI